jgi:mono/diheme cytochrome c family protein
LPHLTGLTPNRLCLILALFALAALAACGGQAADVPPPTPTLSPQLLAGQRAFVENCGACHSTAADTVIVGPSLAGITERGATRVDGLDARTYIYSSIMQPEDYIVEGFDNLMPKDLAKKMTGEEIDSIVAYLFALDEAPR